MNFMSTVRWRLFSLFPFSVLAVAHEDCRYNEEEIENESLVHLYNIGRKSEYSEERRFRFVDRHYVVLGLAQGCLCIEHASVGEWRIYE